MKSVQPRRWMSHALIGGAAVAIALMVAGLTGGAQQKGEWPLITGGNAGTRYSPLDEIDTGNVASLDTAWTFRLRPDGGAGLRHARARRLR